MNITTIQPLTGTRIFCTQFYKSIVINLRDTLLKNLPNSFFINTLVRSHTSLSLFRLHHFTIVNHLDLFPIYL